MFSVSNGMKAKKQLGQNFLQSPKIVSRMVKSASVTDIDTVLEIGPGKGILTKALLETGAKVFAVEKDRDLILILKEKFSEAIANKQLVLIEGDVLKIDVQEICETKYKIVANIPYYITGEILRFFLEQEHQPASMTLLVQKEVAQRIVATQKKETILSLSVKIFGTPSIKEIVKKSMFRPAPKVDSAVILIDNISKQKLQATNLSAKQFFDVVKQGLSQKRKTLLHNLKVFNKKNELCDTFQSLQRDLKVRGEDLSLDEWLIIAKVINS